MAEILHFCGKLTIFRTYPQFIIKHGNRKFPIYTLLSFIDGLPSYKMVDLSMAMLVITRG